MRTKAAFFELGKMKGETAGCLTLFDEMIENSTVKRGKIEDYATSFRIDLIQSK